MKFNPESQPIHSNKKKSKIVKQGYQPRKKYEIPKGHEYTIANEQRTTKVESREAKRKYFHVTDRRYQPGDIIDGYSTAGHTDEPLVYLSNAPEPHLSLQNRDLSSYFVYQVIPIGKTRTGWDGFDRTAKSVRVVKMIGSAQGFVAKGKYSTMPRRTPRTIVQSGAKKKTQEAKKILGED